MKTKNEQVASSIFEVEYLKYMHRLLFKQQDKGSMRVLRYIYIKIIIVMLIFFPLLLKQIYLNDLQWNFIVIYCFLIKMARKRKKM